jgi:hypothetical protein
MVANDVCNPLALGTVPSQDIIGKVDCNSHHINVN